ncbi:MAG: hypothetical protein COV35_03720 [Alphaproteobacteria bacterium CG11_big_fil_rev_8_21_14_0_20_39_49]|nr:MAG: hypothetical protein COV35_03720 [Alphaproteobacteria bacterium CG11_big_fil_rev_8_21_14_0_20_39_49]
MRFKEKYPQFNYRKLDNNAIVAALSFIDYKACEKDEQVYISSKNSIKKEFDIRAIACGVKQEIGSEYEQSVEHLMAMAQIGEYLADNKIPAVWERMGINSKEIQEQYNLLHKDKDEWVSVNLQQMSRAL